MELNYWDICFKTYHTYVLLLYIRPLTHWCHWDQTHSLCPKVAYIDQLHMATLEERHPAVYVEFQNGSSWDRSQYEHSQRFLMTKCRRVWRCKGIERMHHEQCSKFQSVWCDRFSGCIWTVGIHFFGDSGKTFDLDQSAVMPPDVVNDMKTVREIGLQLYTEFLSNQISSQRVYWSHTQN